MHKLHARAIRNASKPLTNTNAAYADTRGSLWRSVVDNVHITLVSSVTLKYLAQSIRRAHERLQALLRTFGNECEFTGHRTHEPRTRKGGRKHCVQAVV